MSDNIITTIVEKAKIIIESSKELKEQIDELSEWNGYGKVLNNIALIVSFVESVTITVENIYDEIKESFGDGTSSETKLEAAAATIDELLDFPIWLEIVDKYIIKIVISMVVHYLNERYGHEWLLDARF
jgi:hypothetical protein